MNYILFDDDDFQGLLPLTYTRAIADIRVGILTIKEKWERYLESKFSIITKPYLQDKFPPLNKKQNIHINARYLPDEKIVKAIKKLSENQAIAKGNDLIAFFCPADKGKIKLKDYQRIQFEDDILQIKNTTDIFLLNDKAIRADFSLLTKGKTSKPIPENVHAICKENIFIEEGASVMFSSLNASDGPIYIGKNTQIMEFCAIRGPFAMCENSVLKMGTKIYGATTLGPHCRVGGELKNVVFFGYSNKGHDGYLGNSVIGQWCNLGAGTNSSNLKNNYTKVKLWNYKDEDFISTGLQFCGLIMADHSKCGIGTKFNTGTVVGVGANIFEGELQPNFIPSFSWGQTKNNTYKLESFLETTSKVMKRRKITFDQIEQKIIKTVFEKTSKYRSM